MIRSVMMTRRSFSSVGDAAAAQVGPIPLVKEHPVRPLFPWRHENLSNILPRLDRKTKEFEATIAFPTPQEPFAVLFLGVSLTDALIFGNWKHELAQNMAFAFIQGLSGIISNVYRIQPEETLVDDETVSFSFPVDKETTNNNDGDSSESQEEPKVYSPHVEEMLARPLRKLFESAHESGRDQLRIVLETKPVSSHFYRFYAIPFYTRNELEENPTIIKDLYNDGKPEWNTLFNTLQGHTMDQLERHDAVDTTLAAEVYIICEEKFQVLDAETGMVLQGPEGVPATQKVGHVVTFEMTTRNHSISNFPYMRTEPGNWQITDIDDLVSVKKWYHIP